MLKKFGIPVILCVIVILTGCDQGQNMMKPVATSILTDETPKIEQQDDTLTIDFNPEITKHTMPNDFIPLETDVVSRSLEQPSQVFQTAKQAVEDQDVQEFIKRTEKKFEEYCKTLIDDMSEEIELHFTNRDERKKFAEALPENGFSYYDKRILVIVDSSNVYFTLTINQFFKCEE